MKERLAAECNELRHCFTYLARQKTAGLRALIRAVIAGTTEVVTWYDRAVQAQNVETPGHDFSRVDGNGSETRALAPVGQALSPILVT
ncbi:MAG TPA: hypothetical protein VI756_01390 [Blastocatellia bacterium]